jgi:hypothetical protein
MKIVPRLLAASTLAVVAGCTTTANIRIPENTGFKDDTKVDLVNGTNAIVYPTGSEPAPPAK